jgi:hypothetical protein
MWNRLARVDRRWIFLTILIVVAAPFIFGWYSGVGAISPTTQAIFDFIDKLPAGTPVMIAFDYGPASMAELHPMAMGLARHILTKKLRLIGVSLDPQGANLGEDALEKVAKALKADKGRDWVNLGYKPGYLSVMGGLGTNILKVFPTDYSGAPLAKQPVMAGVKTYSDIGFVIDLASSNSPSDWIAVAHGRYKANVAVGVTAVMAVDYYPYLQSKQIVGLLNGLKGAAEYESLVHQLGMASLGMTSQSIAHVVIILFVVLGNVGYFAARRRRG